MLTTLEPYIIGANAKLLSTVIFPLSDNLCYFYIFSGAFSVKNSLLKIIFKVYNIIFNKY